ncbi:pyridoxamine 5'-phosphate oxidase family protein [Mangrovicoccus algicola]|uniref:Pyridoxamine 5'-phosphate oxidase family protein n=1 Tax=Mangrovicoccus algicola TaxID=2771008 RepID=A0A8J7CJZ6_9RHOB|nr:pyridoxamine 5'-phosphate oxidase family protein [Mangrovicoccus algicola]MBE3638086.1 pyridoxamine 5'-phosphate oxidase family protein [Mangrovicoccus algicola]
MDWIDSEAELEALYGAAVPAALVKVADRITPEYRPWIEAARFCVLATVGPEGTDASPRGDDGPVLRILDAHNLALPDWHGNNRIDSLRNIVRDGRVSLMLMIPGETNVVRINGRARLTADAALLAEFETRGRQPRTVTVIAVDEIYIQCARALMRAGLWTLPETRPELPSAGEILAARSRGDIDGEDYDRSWPKRAAKTLW